MLYVDVLLVELVVNYWVRLIKSRLIPIKPALEPIKQI
ncbi:hypothetical protein HMPREF1210_02696 [Paenisporosarcina sp. HGH0030]|nr:hypothetical protein HMPREF1210_02696 [Paenisporosarcina sp. HGH0030]